MNELLSFTIYRNHCIYIYRTGGCFEAMVTKKHRRRRIDSRPFVNFSAANNWAKDKIDELLREQ